MDTIFALSSGAPPAGIAVVRISGPQAREVLRGLTGTVPPPRHARFAQFRDADGALLDQGLALWFPGPGNATGEDLAELHLHGGRAIVGAVERSLAALPGMRRAEAGEFTRRAFANGRMDLAEAEGLADLLEAETDMQRQAALELAGGALSRKVEGWQQRLLVLSAQVEAALDFEDEVGGLSDRFSADLAAFADDLAQALDAPSAEQLREGYRVALAGPPNAGKSTLFNAMVENEAALTSPVAGTTRDVLERSVGIEGVPLTFVDMAGLNERASDPVVIAGIERAQGAIAQADLVLWFGREGQGPHGAWEIEAKIDEPGSATKRAPRHRISVRAGAGIAELRNDIVSHARNALRRPGQVALKHRQRLLIEDARRTLGELQHEYDPLIIAEHLRLARLSFDRLAGRASTEDVLDTLFGRFCIGK